MAEETATGGTHTSTISFPKEMIHIWKGWKDKSGIVQLTMKLSATFKNQEEFEHFLRTTMIQRKNTTTEK